MPPEVALALALAIAPAPEPPKLTAAPAFPPRIVIPDVPKTAPKPLPKASLPLHSHRCPACGTTWWHDDRSFNNAAAHACPNCGRVTWAVHSRAPAEPAQRRPLALSPLGGGWYGPSRVTQEPCPPGRP